MKKRIISMLLLCSMIIGCFAGCVSDDTPDLSKIPDEIKDAVAEATSVEAAITIDFQARVGTSASSSGHNASLAADITVTSTKSPFSYHGEYYSNIMVDGVSTREDKEYYVVPGDVENSYLRFEYSDDTEEWAKSTLTRAESLALPLKTCMIQNWDQFLTSMTCQRDPVSISGKEAYLFSGNVPAIFIQELIGDKVFGSFLYSIEQLLEDEIPCKAYFDATTFLPIEIEIDFMDSFIVNDMIFESGMITVSYSDWSELTMVDLPKKINVVAGDSTANFYASYYAWNLFLPYLNNSTGTGNTAGNTGLSFTTSWETYQVRIDQGMTALPLTYQSLNNLGYTISSSYSSNILEPNSYIENVPVQKGRDEIYCTFYNANTSPMPIADCNIGCIDVYASGIVQNGISIYLPGEITLGVTRAALESAYGDPDQKSEGFSCDTYVWNGGTAGQSFLAEISPVTDEVIRLRLENVPIVQAISGDNTADTTPETTPDA